MASIHGRHKRSCALGDTYRKATVERRGNGAKLLSTEGCTCESTLFVMVAAGWKDDPASRWQERKGCYPPARQASSSGGRGTFEEIRSVRFDSGLGHGVGRWARAERGDEAQLRRDDPPSQQDVRPQGGQEDHPGDIRAFNVALRERGMSESTRAKHLRVLRKCFSDAVDHGFAAINPVKKLPRALRSPSRPREGPSRTLNRRSCPSCSPRSPRACGGSSLRRRSRLECD